jgi:hypothetical protein
MNPMLLAAKLHGHIAWLAVALCLHPVVSLRVARRISRGARWSMDLAALGLLLTTLAGWALYPAYREEIRLQLYAAAPAYGLAFEVKEHLAWYATMAAIAGAASARASIRVHESGRARLAQQLLRAARRSFIVAGVLGVVVIACGLLVASALGFRYGVTPR